jgi:hypothetical protein
VWIYSYQHTVRKYTTQRKIISKINFTGFSLRHLGMVVTIVSVTTPKGSRDLRPLPVAMVLVLLYYYYSKKKARETEKRYGGKSTGKMFIYIMGEERNIHYSGAFSLEKKSSNVTTKGFTWECVRMRNRKLRNMRSNITYPKTTNVCKNCNY